MQENHVNFDNIAHFSHLDSNLKLNIKTNSFWKQLLWLIYINKLIKSSRYWILLLYFSIILKLFTFEDQRPWIYINKLAVHIWIIPRQYKSSSGSNSP